MRGQVVGPVYRSRVEAREEMSPRTMPSVTISPFGEMTSESRTVSPRPANPACPVPAALGVDALASPRLAPPRSPHTGRRPAVALLTTDLAGARAYPERSRRRSVELGFRAGEINAELGLAPGALTEARQGG